MRLRGCCRMVHRGALAWLIACALGLVGLVAQAAPLVTTDSPIGFFTNIASRLLASQMGLDLNHIQVYPTNQYTPAVHRVLQVTANLYDAATNRPFAADYPFLPTVFRPLFRRDTDGSIFIAGYREVADDTVARFDGSGPTNVVLGANDCAVPLVGTPFATDETSEPLVTGIPLVIGAKKGLPNFNEFGMQTTLSVSRKLQFRRPDGSDTGPIVETNQMLLAAITNTCGVEAWNSYLVSYPRNLELRLDTVMVAVMTNELGMLLLSNAVPLRPAGALIPTNTWQGFPLAPTFTPYSFKALLSSFLFLSNGIYSDSLHSFVPLGDFERGRGFPVPQWWLSLRPMVRFAMVDTSVSPARIVDYVSLDSAAVPVEVVSLLTGGASCGSQYVPSGDLGAQWCTNRDNSSVFAPTYGVLNQITVGLGTVASPQWSTGAHPSQVDFFRTQFGLAPIYYPWGTFSLTNTFQCPYSPTRVINFYTRWQANDPLVHYTVPDLTDALSHLPAYEFDTTGYSSLANLGGLDWITVQRVGAATPLNPHYRPWGASPLNISDTVPPTNWRLELKDPLASRSDAWAFPTNLLLDLSGLGQVHRGTPWQSIYLKSSAIDLATWAAWTGDTQLAPQGLPGTAMLADASLTVPTNDWQLAPLLVSLLSTNDPRTLMSVNEWAPATWAGALDGLVALTNTAPDSQLQAYRGLGGATFLPVVMQADSPQAEFIAAGIIARLGSQYHPVGDLLGVPELSVVSPFLNQGSYLNPYISPHTYTYQQTWGISDAAYEALPAQLLPHLRPDSLVSILPGAGPLQVQFTGGDGYRYAVQVSSNLVDWINVSTNYPCKGQFLFQEATPASKARFYRSSLLP